MTAKASTEAVWAERVQAWREVGGSAEAFAKGRGYSGSALRLWGGRLSPRTGRSPRIVALVPRSSGSSTPGRAASGGELVIEVGSSRVRVAAGFDRALLVEVLSVLGAAR